MMIMVRMSLKPHADEPYDDDYEPYVDNRTMANMRMMRLQRMMTMAERYDADDAESYADDPHHDEGHESCGELRRVSLL